MTVSKLASLTIAALVLVGCVDETSRLVVDVRTELVAGVEFDAVRTEVLAGPASGRFAEHTVADGDYAAGVRVAELDELARGPVTVRVSLLRDGATVVQRPVRVELSGPMHGATVILVRDCVGVTCPLAGGDPVAAACVGGTCQDERCTEETPEFCEPECTDASECGGGASCARAECAASGTCFLRADDALCLPDQTCDVVEGCLGGAPACDPFPGAELDLHAYGDATCVTARDAAPLCWGKNELWFGPPAGTNLEAPRAVFGPAGLTAFSLGFDHYCALDSAGAVHCNGDDWAGQLGDGPDASPTDGGARLSPDLPGAAIAISAGFGFSCAIVSGGQAWCWGHSNTAQVGSMRLIEEIWSPEQVAGTHRFTAIDASHTHACALDDAQRIWCWGGNANEQLARPMETDVYATPVQIEAGVAFTAVSAGDEFTLGLSSTGDVWAWGASYAGQLGREGSGTPTPGVIAGPQGYTQIDAGYRHACGIRDGGELRCWGDDTYDQIGPNAPAMVQAEPVVVAPDRTWVDVAVGEGHTCALDDTGRVFCWGDNSASQGAGPSGPGGPAPRPVCPP